MRGIDNGHKDAALERIEGTDQKRIALNLVILWFNCDFV